MKSVCVFVVVFVAAFAAADYAKKHENFDVDSLMANDKSLKHYTQCFLGETECEPLAGDVKATLLEAFKDGCSKCSPKQINNMQRVVAYMKQHDHHKHHVDRMLSTLDPTNKAGHIYDIKALQAIKNSPALKQ